MRYIFMLLLLFATPAFACGPDSNCVIGDRFYRIAMPEGHDGKTPVGALVWVHGYRGTTMGVMRNGNLRRMVSDAGLALIAVQGVNGSWNLPYGPAQVRRNSPISMRYWMTPQPVFQLTETVSSLLGSAREA